MSASTASTAPTAPKEIKIRLSDNTYNTNKAIMAWKVWATNEQDITVDEIILPDDEDEEMSFWVELEEKIIAMDRYDTGIHVDVNDNSELENNLVGIEEDMNALEMVDNGNPTTSPSNCGTKVAPQEKNCGDCGGCEKQSMTNKELQW